MDPHQALLARAGHAPDGWLAIAREALAAGDLARVAELQAALEPVLAQRPPKTARGRFSPEGSHEEADRAVVAAVAAQDGTVACWASTRDGQDRVYLVQANENLPATTVAVQRVLEDTPRVEVFGPRTRLPAYHEAALLAATLLWSAEPAAPVRVARAFDGASPKDGPWFDPSHELVVDVNERQRLLDFLRGGEVVLTTDIRMTDVLTASAGAVPADLRSDGSWVWSEASRYYLERHRLAPDAELAEHALRNLPKRKLSPLDRHRVRAALNLDDHQEEGPLWRAG
jgi:hypothetical protein